MVTPNTYEAPPVKRKKNHSQESPSEVVDCHPHAHKLELRDLLVFHVVGKWWGMIWGTF